MRIARSTRKGLVIPRMPLVALIDVVLFLLLYFMMAGNLAPVEANLATALKTDGGRAAGADLVPQILDVDHVAGVARFRIGSRAASDRASLTEILRQLPKEGGVVVRAAGSALVADVASAVQACKDAAFRKVSYVPGR